MRKDPEKKATNFGVDVDADGPQAHEGVSPEESPPDLGFARSCPSEEEDGVSHLEELVELDDTSHENVLRLELQIQGRLTDRPLHGSVRDSIELHRGEKIAQQGQEDRDVIRD